MWFEGSARATVVRMSPADVCRGVRGIGTAQAGSAFTEEKLLGRATGICRTQGGPMSAETQLKTSVPLGSPHVAKPPLFDRWGLGPGHTDRRDQREYARREIACDVWLVDAASWRWVLDLR